jgi:hypothetical protein
LRRRAFAADAAELILWRTFAPVQGEAELVLVSDNHQLVSGNSDCGAGADPLTSFHFFKLFLIKCLKLFLTVVSGSHRLLSSARYQGDEIIYHRACFVLSRTSSVQRLLLCALASQESAMKFKLGRLFGILRACGMQRPRATSSARAASVQTNADCKDTLVCLKQRVRVGR